MLKNKLQVWSFFPHYKNYFKRGKTKLKKRNRILALLLALSLALSMITPLNVFAQTSAPTTLVGLKTNDLVNPVGIDTENPVFSWKMDSAVTGQKQTAYQLVVAKDEGLTQIVWDSQKQQDNDTSVGIQYAGAPLESSTTYYWAVTAWDKDGAPVRSDVASFEMGLLGDNAWSDSEWIQVGSSAEPPITRYTIDADIQIVQTSVSLLWEASDKNNYLMWQFNNKNGYMEFKPHSHKNGNWNVIRQMNVDEYLNGSSTDVQHMTIEVIEESVKTYLNGHLIETIPVSDLGGVGFDGTMGRLGFRSHSFELEAGYLDNIVVTGESGEELKRYDFEDGVNPFDDGAVENGRLNTKYTSTETISLEKDKEQPVDPIHYVVEADLTCEQDAISILFNAADAKNFYMMQLNVKDNPGRVLFKPHTWKGGAFATYAGHNKDVTDLVGGADGLRTNPVQLKIEVTEKKIFTTLNGQLVDEFTFGELSDQGTTGIPAQTGYLGFRADLAESGTVDNLKLTDYTDDEVGKILFDYTFEEENPYPGGSIENGVFHTAGTGILLPTEASVTEASGAATFRKEVTPKADLVSAKLYTAGLGVYDVFIDGARVGTTQPDGSVVYDELKPGYTHHSKRTVYSTYDVTGLLDSGRTSTISAHVTSGWWSGAAAGNYGQKEAFRAQLLLTYADGSQSVVGTDTSWKTSFRGPVMYGDIYGGETYDGNADLSFRQSGYDDSAWNYAEINREFNGVICSLTGEPVRVREDLEITPDSVTVYDGATGAAEDKYGSINVIGSYADGDSFTLNPGETAVVNMGQNFAGWDELQLEGAKGTVVTMRHGEMLNDNDGLKSRGNDGPEGSIYTANLRSAKATGRYILNGQGTETYHSTMTFYGFQYLEITTTQPVTIHRVRGLVLTSVATDTGRLTTSNADVNQLISNIVWGQYGNYLSVPTDCPQRDERKGWTADAQVFSTAASYIGDVKGFLEKYMDDMNDSQVVGGFYDGAYPDTAPYNGYGEIGQLGWGDAGVIIPYNLYKMYGDTSIIEECYPYMQKFMDVFMASTNKYGGGHNHGDHLSYESNDDEVKNIFGIAYFAWDAQMMAEMAAVLGKTEDVAKFQAVYEEEKAFFQELFVNPDGSLKRTEQTACLMALKMDLLPDDNSRELVKQALLDNIKRNGNKLQTGFLGTAIIMQTLSDIGASDVAYQLLLQRGNPSWLYSVDQGATTIWERWNSYTIEGGFGPVSMNSFNHYAYGAVAEWMYGYMAGILYDVSQPGFKHIILQPTPDQSIRQVDCSYDSAYGTIISNWRYSDGSFAYDATIPANATATIYIPVEEGASLTVNGKDMQDVTTERDGLTYLETKDGKAVFEAVAGSYSFTTSVTEYCTISLSQSDSAVDTLVSINGGAFQKMPPSIQVEKGSTLTLQAMPENDVDYAVSGWTGGLTSDQDTITLTPQQDLSLTAQVTWVGHDSLAQGKQVTSNNGWDVADWSSANLVDGILTTEPGSAGYTTQQGHTPDVDYWVEIDLGEDMTFNRVQLYPRSDTVGVNGGAASFPKDFSFEVKQDGAEEYTTVSSYTDYQAQLRKPSVFEFEAVTARYIRLHVTKLGEPAQADPNYYFLQLAEMGVYNVADVPEPSDADKTILRSVLAYAQAQFDSEEFDNVIEMVQESFTAALEHARTVEQDPAATQAVVDQAWQALMTEIHKLGFVRGDKTSLGQLIEVANGFNDNIDRYTPETAEPFVAALAAAKETYGDGNALQDDVAKAEDALLNAMLGLRYKADKSILQAVLAEAAQVNTAFYTAQSVSAFDAASGTAEAVYSNPDATQAEIDAAAAALRNAIDSLQILAGSETGTAVQGDSQMTAGNGSAKTGETTPIAAGIALFSLACAGVVLSKKKK